MSQLCGSGKTCPGTHSQVRRNFIEADAAVPLHVLLCVDFQFLVGIHRHQHRANVGLENRTESRELTGGLEAQLRCLWRLDTHPAVLGMLLRVSKKVKGAEEENSQLWESDTAGVVPAMLSSLSKKHLKWF